MADRLMYRPREWVVQINELMLDNRNSRANADVILRVPTPLFGMKPEAYVPQIVCLGPYHNIDSSSVGTKISTAEAYKTKSAAFLSQKLRGRRSSFDKIVEMMQEQMLPEISRFYDWPLKEGEYSKNFALAMTLDSFFLLLFLLEIPEVPRPTKHAAGGQSRGIPSLDSDQMISYFRIYESSIAYDIMKLENQIPLSLLRSVFDKVKEALISDVVRGSLEHFNQLLLRRVLHTNLMTPFWIAGESADTAAIGDAMAREPHYLGCLHSFVSQFLHIQFGGVEQQAEPTLWQRFNDILERLTLRVCDFLPALAAGERQFLKGINAGQLANAGIKFKSFTKLSDKIRLEKYSGTLYLPRIIVTETGTEVWLRNMVALEFNDTTRSKSVTRYVGLMGCLITSADDVRLLMDREVISRGSLALSDESTVKMWNDVRQPFNSTSFLRIPDELSHAFEEVLTKKYYKGKIRRTFWAIFYYVRSWKFMAPLGVFLGLSLTAIQTYCTMYNCSFGHKSKHN